MVQLSFKKKELEMLRDLLNSTQASNICTGDDEEVKCYNSIIMKVEKNFH